MRWRWACLAVSSQDVRECDDAFQTVEVRAVHDGQEWPVTQPSERFFEGVVAVEMGKRRCREQATKSHGIRELRRPAA